MAGTNRPTPLPRSARRPRGPLLRRLAAGVAVIGVLATDPAPAMAQVNTQLWGNITIDWLKSHRLSYELDFEPKVLLTRPEGEPGWANLDLTPSVEYVWKPWFDVVGETVIGQTQQTDDVSTFEVSPRVGARFHFLSRNVRSRGPFKERIPTRGLQVRDFVRIEWRNLFNSGSPDESSVRLRNRLELLYPVTRRRITDDGATYILADWEWFVPLGDVEERFANKQRVRTGIGYRRSFKWRFELIYAWTRSRATIEDDFATADNIFDIRVKRVFD